MSANHKWLWDVARWTLLILGIGKLLIVIAGAIQYILATILLGIIFVIYLRKVKGEQDIARHIMLTSLSVLVFSYLYDLAVLLNLPARVIVVEVIATIAFAGAGLLAKTLIKVKYVAP